jgi:fatty acid-binding protein DegV
LPSSLSRTVLEREKDEFIEIKEKPISVEFTSKSTEWIDIDISEKEGTHRDIDKKEQVDTKQVKEGKIKSYFKIFPKQKTDKGFDEISIEIDKALKQTSTKAIEEEYPKEQPLQEKIRLTLNFAVKICRYIFT